MGRIALLILMISTAMPPMGWAINVGSGTPEQIFGAVKAVAGRQLGSFSLKEWGEATGLDGRRIVDLDGGPDSPPFLADGMVEWSDPLYQVTHYATLLNLLEKGLKPLGILDENKPQLDAIRGLTIRQIEAIRKLPSASPAAQDELRQQFEEKYAWLKEDLVQRLNRSLARRGNQSFTFTVGQFPRGGGEVLVKIEVIPPNAQVSFINLFNFLVCEQRKVDPWNVRDCYGWNDVLSSRVSLAGDYKYQAHWPDGKAKRSSFTITSKVFDTSADEVNYPLIIKKP